MEGGSIKAPPTSDRVVGGRPHTARVGRGRRYVAHNSTEGPNEDITRPKEFTNSFKIQMPKDPPKTARPQSIRRASLTDSQSFTKDLIAFLDRELKATSSDADRVSVYQRAFDFVTSEFQLCRPLLEKIKKHYDKIATDLIIRKREMMADTITVNDTEENYNEIVTKLRKARSNEFKKTRADSEKLLDELTELRLQRYQLIAVVDKLKKQRKELQTVEGLQAAQIEQINSDIQNTSDKIKEVEVDTTEIKVLLAQATAKLNETTASAKDIDSSLNSLKKEIEELKTIRDTKAAECKEAEDAKIEASKELLEIKKQFSDTEREKKIAIEKLESLKSRTEATETRIRNMLIDMGLNNPDLSVYEIIKNLNGK